MRLQSKVDELTNSKMELQVEVGRLMRDKRYVLQKHEMIGCKRHNVIDVESCASATEFELDSVRKGIEAKSREFAMDVGKLAGGISVYGQ